MEAWTDALHPAATPRRRPGPGGTNRWQPTWPLAAGGKSGTQHRSAKPRLRLTPPDFRRNPATRIIRRTAGYGPVCPVVWEGRRRKTPPYPDMGALRASLGDDLDLVTGLERVARIKPVQNQEAVERAVDQRHARREAL